MKSFEDVVKLVSNNFLFEAKQSPQLIADMAKMEYYMAENYSGRLFIELLQNADDAKSSRIISYYNNGNLYFANNGKPFDENDLIAISRSGASDKKRGKTIGYRGIGFKSASTVSSEIIIHSANTYFTFSKEKCSKLLNMNNDDVPTIRIPLFLDNIEKDVADDVELLKNKGYSTIFAFKNANIKLYLDEIQDIKNGHFIFLNSLYECVFSIDYFTNEYEINRFNDLGNEHVEIRDRNKKEEWMIIKNRSTSIAFLIRDSIIVPCEDKQAVYHCYLPTLEESIIACKINADFSTDPSRKHITMDEKTKDSLKQIGNAFIFVLETAFDNADAGEYKNILNMFLRKKTISKINNYLNDYIESEIKRKKWLKLENGKLISPGEYKTLPSSFDISKPESIRTVQGEISLISLSKDVYENIDNVESFLSQYSTQKINMDIISKDLSNIDYVKKLNSETYTQLLSNAIREMKIDKTLNPDNNIDLNMYIIKTSNEEYQSINSVVSKKGNLYPALRKELNERLTISEIKWMQEQVCSSDLIVETIQENEKNIQIGKRSDNNYTLTTHIAKWRDAENKCISIEESLGNNAEDVSLKNYGYDVESITPEGKKRYIEVKSVKKDFSFSLTNNEYTAAHQYGEDYYICLLLEDDNKLEVRYIQNPLRNAKFEKRIKQWEWFCIECDTINMTFELSNS